MENNSFHYLADLGQILMDLYYQDYRPADAFFRIHHFNFIAAAVYNRILEDEYKEARTVSRQNEGDTEIVLSGDWLIHEDTEVKDSKAVLQHRAVSFPFDKMGYTVQDVQAVDGKCDDFIRISVNSIWKFKRMPKNSKAFYYIKDNTVYFVSNCNLKKVIISYVPDVADPSFGEDGGVIPATKRELIFTRALLLFQQAANGTVIDMSNDANPNHPLQTEVNNVFQGIRTKQ